MIHQRQWLISRGINGGDAWLLIQLDSYYWYYWSDILDIDLTAMTLADHRRSARHKVSELTTENIVFVLTKLNDISAYRL
jgi:hypothetical protein